MHLIFIIIGFRWIYLFRIHTLEHIHKAFSLRFEKFFACGSFFEILNVVVMFKLELGTDDIQYGFLTKFFLNEFMMEFLDVFDCFYGQNSLANLIINILLYQLDIFSWWVNVFDLHLFLIFCTDIRIY